MQLIMSSVHQQNAHTQQITCINYHFSYMFRRLLAHLQEEVFYIYEQIYKEFSLKMVELSPKNVGERIIINTCILLRMCILLVY